MMAESASPEALVPNERCWDEWVQGTEQWRHTNRIRALIGECGEISDRGKQAVLGSREGRGADGGRSFINHKSTGRASHEGLCPSFTPINQGAEEAG